MKKLTRLAIFATCGLVLFLFFTNNLALALTTQGEFVMWRPPFSDRSRVVPDWTWGTVHLGDAAGVLIVAVLWCSVGLRTWRFRGIDRPDRPFK